MNTLICTSLFSSISLALDIAWICLPLILLVYLCVATCLENKKIREREAEEDKRFEDDMIQMYGGDPESGE